MRHCLQEDKDLDCTELIIVGETEIIKQNNSVEL